MSGDGVPWSGESPAAGMFTLAALALAGALLAGMGWRHLVARVPWWATMFAVATVYLGVSQAPWAAFWFDFDFVLFGPVRDSPANQPWFAAMGLLTALVAGTATFGFAALAGIDTGLRGASRRHLAGAVLVGLACAAFSALFTTAYDHFAGVPTDQLVTHAFLADRNPWWVRAVFAGIALSAVPFVEELVFRGVVFGLLHRRFGDAVALSVTAALFGFLHGVQPAVLASALTYGVAWGWLRARSGSIVPGLVAHVVTNACALMIPG